MIVPLDSSQSLSCLSAILLNDEYYHFLSQDSWVINGIPILSETT